LLEESNNRHFNIEDEITCGRHFNGLLRADLMTCCQKGACKQQVGSQPASLNANQPAACWLLHSRWKMGRKFDALG